MSAATSPGTGLAYGLRRVCAAWGMARSSFYAMTSGQHAKQPPAKRRGPKTRHAVRQRGWTDHSQLVSHPLEQIHAPKLNDKVIQFKPDLLLRKFC